MLSESYRVAVSQLSSNNMEQLHRRIVDKLGINRHYAPHLQMQAVLTAPFNVVESVVKEFVIGAMYGQTINENTTPEEGRGAFESVRDLQVPDVREGYLHPEDGQDSSESKPKLHGEFEDPDAHRSVSPPSEQGI